jgi:hypothetical protein
MLKVYFNRMVSGLSLAGCLVVMFMCVVALIRAGTSIPYIAQTIIWIVLLAMAAGVITSVRRLFNPPLMYSADRRGIMIYYDAKHNCYSNSGVFLPWDIVGNLTLEEIIGFDLGRNRAKSWVIVCKLKSSAPFPVRPHSPAWGTSWDDLTVSMNAENGTVTKQELLDSLIQLWHSGNTHHV